VPAREFRIETSRKIERHDVTEEVARAAEALGVSDGALLVSVPHTTAAITLGENWDPDVTSDLERALAAWVPPVRFDHGEGNSAAHFLSEAIGTSRLVPLESGKPVLGQWQGIFLIELDGPRTRRVRVGALAASAKAGS
jgi:secondary thiamine-phosphate synthase enzyme